VVRRFGKSRIYDAMMAGCMVRLCRGSIDVLFLPEGAMESC